MDTIFYISYAAMWVLLLLEGVLLVLLYRHFGIQALGTIDGVQRDGLPVGSLAPAVSGFTAEGTRVSWSERPEYAKLLLFVAPQCGPCARILPYVNYLAESTRDGPGFGVLAVVFGQQDAVTQLIDKFKLTFPCLAEGGSGTADRYRVRATPFAFVIGSDGRILAKGLCDKPGRLGDLLAAGGLSEAAVLRTAITEEERSDSLIAAASGRVSA